MPCRLNKLIMTSWWPRYHVLKRRPSLHHPSFTKSASTALTTKQHKTTSLRNPAQTRTCLTRIRSICASSPPTWAFTSPTWTVFRQSCLGVFCSQVCISVGQRRTFSFLCDWLIENSISYYGSIYSTPFNWTSPDSRKVVLPHMYRVWLASVRSAGRYIVIWWWSEMMVHVPPFTLQFQYLPTVLSYISYGMRTKFYTPFWPR